METTLTILLDEVTAKSLEKMAASSGTHSAEMAVRLIRRAIRAARPRPVYDTEALRAYVAEHLAEELALADSDIEHRAQLLADEDVA